MQNKFIILQGIFFSFSLHLYAGDLTDSDEENAPAFNRCLGQLCCHDEPQILNYCGDGTEGQNSEPVGSRFFNALYVLAQVPSATLGCLSDSAWQSFLSLTHGPSPDYIFAPISCCDNRCIIHPFGFDAAANWRPSRAGDNPLEPVEFEQNSTSSGHPYEIVRWTRSSGRAQHDNEANR